MCVSDDKIHNDKELMIHLKWIDQDINYEIEFHSDMIPLVDALYTLGLGLLREIKVSSHVSSTWESVLGQKLEIPERIILIISHGIGNPEEFQRQRKEASMWSNIMQNMMRTSNMKSWMNNISVQKP